jgi:hypothetical protein
MNRIGTLVVLSALLLVGSGTALADPKPTFDTCEDAFNFGSNSAKMWVSAAMNRASCNGLQVATAEAQLAKTLKKQKIPAHNSEEHKVCFYQGLYAGYVDQLGVERASCGQGLPIVSVARAALSVFGAMVKGLDSVENSEIDQVFDGGFDTEGQDGDACASFIANEGDDLEADLSELIKSVCFED